MANVIPSPTAFQRRINNYVPGMQYAVDVNLNSPSRVPLGTPPAGVANNLLNGQSTGAGATVDLTGNVNAQGIVDPWGRTIQFVASLAGVANVITIRGADYLGQPVTENVTLNGVTTVESKKAFKFVDSITVGAPVTASQTFNAGWGTTLGLPWKVQRGAFEVANGQAVGTLGTVTNPVLNDPQTATTGDPRGTYKPTTALNAANVISLVADFSNDLNSSNNGGLHGIRHFNG